MFFLYEIFMRPSIVRTKKTSEKRGRGRPRTDWTSIHLTLWPPQLDRVDAWIEGQDETDLSRPEAIRRLLDRALAAEPAAAKPRRPAKPSKS
jgi:hypothetical protein